MQVLDRGNSLLISSEMFIKPGILLFLSFILQISLTKEQGMLFIGILHGHIDSKS